MAASSPARKGIWIGLLAMLLLLVGLGVWFALSARAAVNEMTVARDSLVAARDALADGQPEQARTFVTAASDAASRAADRVNSPMWNVAAAIPGLGDTPQAAQAVATSLDQTLTALQPLTEQLNVLDPSTLIQEGTDRRRRDRVGIARDAGGRAGSGRGRRDRRIRPAGRDAAPPGAHRRGGLHRGTDDTAEHAEHRA